MSGENHGMRLRPRRSVLGDISNRASIGGSIGLGGPVPDALGLKKNKRLRTSLEGGEENNIEPSGKSKRSEVFPSSSSRLSTSSAISEPDNKRTRKDSTSSSGADEKQEQCVLHVIKRSTPSYVKGSNPAHCLDTIDRMYNIYYEIEDQFSAKPYMSKQKDINQKMRSILIDWLVEVHDKFKLQPQTLWLSINILDRYLEDVQILRSKLQLVGITALLIASKYEEIYPPEVKDCVYITDNAYDRPEILAMETSILTKLEYKITVPTGYHFLIRYLNCIQASESTRHLASYYAERNLQESDMLCVQPHKFAAASIFAALTQQNEFVKQLGTASVWNRTLIEESGLTETDLKPCARNIIRHVREESETANKRRLVATKKKYGNVKYSVVSSLQLPRI